MLYTMTPIQLTEYGKKHWLVDLGCEAPSGGRQVARTEGLDGETLLFDSRAEAEAWIKANPDWVQTTRKHVTPGSRGSGEWADTSVKKLRPLIAECTDVNKLREFVETDERSTAVKLAEARIAELEDAS